MAGPNFSFLSITAKLSEFLNNERGRWRRKPLQKTFFLLTLSLCFVWASWSISLYTQEFISCQRPFVKHFLYRIKNGLHTLTFLIDFVQSIVCFATIHYMINVSKQQPLQSCQNTEKDMGDEGFLHLANLHIFHTTYNFTWGKSKVWVETLLKECLIKRLLLSRTFYSF